MRRTRATALTAVPLVAVLAGSLTACSGDAGAEGTDSATCPNGQIRFGVEPYEDPAKLEPAYRHLADALSAELDCPVELTIVEDYSAEVLAMENGELELAQFGPLGFVFAHGRADAEPLASFGLADGELSSYTAGIWVPADSDVQDAAGLAGASLALGSTGSTSGDALPRTALADAGIAETDVEITYAGGHPEALLALTNGQVDAAQINSQTLATAEREGTFDPSQFRQVWESDPIPNDPITVAGAMPTEFKDAVRDALLTLDTADVEAIGAFLDVDPAGPLVEVDTETYQPLFDLADSLGLTESDV
jgi:phosphonate transport system substrate-binding protein